MRDEAGGPPPDRQRELPGCSAGREGALLKRHQPVTVEAARERALLRGTPLRDALIAKDLPSERLFLAAPRRRASGDEDAEWALRGQRALTTN